VAVLPRVIALAAVAVLSACATQVSGTPVAGDTVPPPEPEELTAEAVFDDFTTVDPCSLTSPDVFDSFGGVDFAPPESLDYCAISVRTSDGEATISVGAFSTIHETPELQGKRVKDIDGGLWVGQYDDTPTYCSQLLVFPDDVTVEVLGAVFDGDTDTCPMVEAGMDHMIEVIQDGDVKHRDPRTESLIEIDPCSLVDSSDVTAIPGLTGVQRMREYPGRHSCFWAAGDDLSLRINFSAGPKPTATEAGGNENPIAGRPTAMNPYPELGSSAFCAVETAHFPFTEVKDADDVFELASVFVRMPKGQVDAACVAARAVAEQLWPDLPPA
jgi:hypothetical protein